MTYSKPKRTVLQYKIDELGNTWAPVDQGKITLSGLSVGDYTLRVRSRMIDGTFCNNEIVKEIVIKPHVLASIPALLMYIFLFAAILISVAKFTRRKSLLTARDAARRESERFEAQRQKQYYASKVEFLMNIAHEIRTP